MLSVFSAVPFNASRAGKTSASNPRLSVARGAPITHTKKLTQVPIGVHHGQASTTARPNTHGDQTPITRSCTITTAPAPATKANTTQKQFPRPVNNAVKNTPSIPASANVISPCTKSSSVCADASYMHAHSIANKHIIPPTAATVAFEAFPSCTSSSRAAASTEYTNPP